MANQSGTTIPSASSPPHATARDTTPYPTLPNDQASENVIRCQVTYTILTTREKALGLYKDMQGILDETSPTPKSLEALDTLFADPLTRVLPKKKMTRLHDFAKANNLTRIVETTGKCLESFEDMVETTHEETVNLAGDAMPASGQDIGRGLHRLAAELEEPHRRELIRLARLVWMNSATEIRQRNFIKMQLDAISQSDQCIMKRRVNEQKESKVRKQRNLVQRPKTLTQKVFKDGADSPVDTKLSCDAPHSQNDNVARD